MAMDPDSSGRPISTKPAIGAALLIVGLSPLSSHAQAVKLTFAADSAVYAPAAEWYQQQWNADGPRILRAMEAASGLRFGNLEIRVIVYLAPSYTGGGDSPMHLNVRYPFGMTLVHELGHRLNSQITNPKDEEKERTREEGLQAALEEHKVLYLYLYDVWVTLYGKRFADAAVEAEKGWASQGLPFYASAWDWALSMTQEQRARRLGELVTRK